MRIAFLAAGAAGMYCGSCIRDAALARAMRKLGEDVLLVPLYTPLKLDRDDESINRIFFGGVNVYLEQKYPFFRKRRFFLDGLLNSRLVLNLASSMAGKTDPAELGDLTVSMLRGENGPQKKELDKLADWLVGEIQPQIINLPNSMFAGVIPGLKRRSTAKIVCSLTGEDLFLESLIEPHKSQALELLRSSIQQADHIVAISRYYANFMSDYLSVSREKISVVPIGINTEGYGRKAPSRPTDPFTVGYLARIAPEKGFHILCEAFMHLRKMPGMEKARLRAAGWLGEKDKLYFERAKKKLKNWGIADAFDYAGEVDFKGKIAFLDSLSVLSVPTVYHDPKGLFVLEALAHGVPVVLPNHGAFPELIEATGGGLLHASENPEALAEKLFQMHQDREATDRMAMHGQMVVKKKFTDVEMARTTLDIYRQLVPE